MTQVSDLLKASLAAHKRAKPTGNALPRPANWKEILTEAARLRKEALELDPGMTDQEWGSSSHKGMVGFYQDMGVWNG